MKIEHLGNGHYQGTLNWHNGSSVIYGDSVWGVMSALIYKAFHDYDVVQPPQQEEPEPVLGDDWEQECRLDEIIGQHKDDDKI